MRARGRRIGTIVVAYALGLGIAAGVGGSPGPDIVRGALGR